MSKGAAFAKTAKAFACCSATNQKRHFQKCHLLSDLSGCGADERPVGVTGEGLRRARGIMRQKVPGDAGDVSRQARLLLRIEDNLACRLMQGQGCLN